VTARRRPDDDAGSIGDRVERAIEEHADAEREIERGEADAKRPWNVRRTVFWLVVTGVSLYLVAPSLIEVAGSWRGLERVDVPWFAAMAALQALTLACLWALQRTALRDPPWRPIITSQLAGNALAKIAPGGGALGAALQYRMLVETGVDRARAVSGLTAVNLLTFAVVLALPVLAIPAFIRGAVSRELIEATIVGLAVFGVLLAGGAALLAFDGPLARVGRQVQRLRNRLRRGAEPLTRLPERLQRERDRLLATLGAKWKRALAETIGRWAFDYGTLLAALAAVGATPRPALVLLAFCAAQVLAQIPVTPGGLGFVEAGLTATLAVAGVSTGDAVLATLAYRLFSYWLPLPVGLAAYAVHRRRLAAAAP
jgi:uncharacterized protein (TIRG00374 family)